MTPQFLRIMFILSLVSAALTYYWLTSPQEAPSVMVVQRKGVTEIILRVPVYITILGQPLSYREFIGLIMIIILGVVGVTVFLFEYVHWRRRRLLRALTTYRHKREVARLPETEYPLYPPFYTLRRRWSTWESEKL